MTSKVDYDTSSYLMTVENILGIDTLPCSADARTVHAMSDLFAVPMTK